jgi:hypothetical protein
MCHVVCEAQMFILDRQDSVLQFRSLHLLWFCGHDTTSLFPLPSVELFWGDTKMCPPVHISRYFLAHEFLCCSWYENDCLIHVLCVSTSPPGLHSGSGASLVVHLGLPLHIITHHIHAYHVDIPWIGVQSPVFRNVTLVSKY